MKKKMISMLLCMTMTASLLAGCAGGSTESGASGTTEEKVQPHLRILLL